MVDDDKFTEVAKTDFTIRIVSGFIFGVLAFVASIIFIVLFAFRNELNLIVPMAVMAGVGALVAVSCGYFLFRKKNKEQ